MSDPKKEEFWEHVEGLPHVNCTEMLRYDP